MDDGAQTTGRSPFGHGADAAREHRRQVSSERPTSGRRWETPFTESIPDPTDLVRTMFETWASLAETVISNTWGIAKQTGETVGAAVRSDETESLAVHVPPGGVGVGRLWLKNHSSTLLEQVRFRSTDPENTRGHAIPRASIRFEPADLDRVLPGASRQIDVHVEVPAATAPGVYHALVLVEPLGDTSRPISIHVAEA